MKSYVLGFAFDEQFDVALIQKRRPEWQAGRLNGVGGKIEYADPDITSAMSREFEEEAGLLIPTDAWDHYATMRKRQHRSSGWVVYVFRTFEVPIPQLKSMTDEQLSIVPAYELPSSVLFNLRWLVPLALDLAAKHTDAAYTEF